MAKNNIMVMSSPRSRESTILHKKKTSKDVIVLLVTTWLCCCQPNEAFTSQMPSLKVSQRSINTSKGCDVSSSSLIFGEDDNMFGLPVNYHRRRDTSSVTRLSAQKKKRRKKERSDSSSTDPFDDYASNNDEYNDNNQKNDLPDFDLKDTNPDTTSTSISDNKAKVGGSRITGEMSVITSNMMSTGMKSQSTKSVRELLADRSLEKKFEFDDENNDNNVPLPDLLAKPVSSSTTTTSATITNRKRERTLEAQRIAALEAAKQEAEENNLLSVVVDKLPGIKNEKGDISPIKILESGTWACIFLLVGWEIYINSPLFDRAGPMAPIVY